MADVVDFDAAMGRIEGARAKHLLLGNGFSIALKPDIFSYGSLYDNADFTGAPHLTAIFQALKTTDFEIVIRHLQDTATILSIYDRTQRALIAQLLSDSRYLKNALVNAIAKRHPDRPFDIEQSQYQYCRTFLSGFNHKFTLNYDVLLYWALMQTDVDDLHLNPDDGFRHPEGDPDQPYVSWQQSHSATVSYLHGALHLFDNGDEIIKYTWSKTDIPIVDQIRSALDDDKFPLFVAEGSNYSKKKRILHNAYLHKASRSFESCVDSPTAALAIYGHSLAENDAHILRCISKGSVPVVLVSLYGDPNSAGNQSIVTKAGELVEQRRRLRPNRPLDIVFYDAASAMIWG